MTTRIEPAAREPITVLVAGISSIRLAHELARRREVRHCVPCGDPLDVPDACARMRPDVVLLPDGASSRLGDCIARLRREVPAAKVLAMTARSDPAFLRMLLRHGACGSIHPHVPIDVLANAIVAVANGGVWVERRVIAETLAYFDAYAEGQRATSAALGEVDSIDACRGLTRREHQIVSWVALGLSNKEVARQLGVSHETVKKHLKAVFAKLGVHHRLEVILRHHA